MSSLSAAPGSLYLSDQRFRNLSSFFLLAADHGHQKTENRRPCKKLVLLHWIPPLILSLIISSGSGLFLQVQGLGYLSSMCKMITLFKGVSALQGAGFCPPLIMIQNPDSPVKAFLIHSQDPQAELRNVPLTKSHPDPLAGPGPRYSCYGFGKSLLFRPC